MIGFVAERLMEMEVRGLTGAAYGDKSAERMAQTHPPETDHVGSRCRQCVKSRARA
jgi:hypothetical protein